MRSPEQSTSDVRRCVIRRAIRTILASTHITWAQGANGRDGETCNACAIPWPVSIEYLIGAVRTEIHVVWSTGHRYLNMDKYFDRRPSRAYEDYSEEGTSVVEQANRLVPAPA